jgi:uracil-DNA glycosylase
MLTDYLERLRATRENPAHVPGLDPSDGGENARILMLLEAPGPKAIATGYVSRRNPDPTARNLTALLAESGIVDEDLLLWNVVPWHVGDGRRIRPVNTADIREARPWIEELATLLPRLDTVVLVGRQAQRATE